jgi:hypothetical protein
VGSTDTINDCSFFGGNPGWCFYTEENPTFFAFAAVVQADGWTDYHCLTSAALDNLSQLSFDETPDCSSSYIGSVSIYDTGQFPIRYFEQRLQLDDLIVGHQYVLTINWESRAYPSGGSWSDFSTDQVVFEATGSSELSPWVSPFDISGAICSQMDGKEVRLKDYSVEELP